MRRLALTASAGILLITAAHAQAQAQSVEDGLIAGSHRVSDYYAAPGLYGTSYGYASYGVPRTYTEFTAMPWSAYPASIPGYGFLPGRHGVGLWRPGSSGPGYIYGTPTSASSYRTFPVVSGTGLTPSQIAPPPSIGVYAPSLGPALGLGDR